MKYFKYILFIFLLLGSLFLTGWFFISQFPGFIPAIKSGSEQQIEALLESNDRIKAVLCLALLQIIQVISIVIPIAPIQLAGGVVFGTVRGFIICHLSYVIGNVIVIFYARKARDAFRILGNRGEKKKNKIIEKLNNGNVFFKLILFCIIPVVPNGIIPYAAAEMDISIPKFALASWIGDLMPSLAFCCAGHLAILRHYILAGLVIAADGIIVLLLLIKYRRMFGSKNQADKDSESNDSENNN